MFKRRAFRPGDLVVYRKAKQSPKPGPRATRISPALHGDNYSYVVDKFWVVDAVGEDGDLLLRTRRGKQHRTSSDDPNLRHASLMTRLLYATRFPEPPARIEASN